MNFALVYIVWRVLYRIKEFFHHWYVHSFNVYGHAVIGFLERLDRVFAFAITIKYFGKPLYQDRTVVGYILGFVFRSGRIIIGAVVYFFVIVTAVVVYLVWCAVHVYVIWRIFV